ncbi:MAG: hypothetical protein WD533_07360 [Dehalococcoidia bacterium]
MAISRTRAQDYAEEVLNRPRGETTVTLRRNKNSVSLLYRGRALTKTHASKVGELQAKCMAMALGVELPTEIGGEVSTKQGSGVIYRAIAISSLDLRKEEAQALLGMHMQTAMVQRGAKSLVVE